jgi:FtsH-binding integral membrane protein
MTKEENQEGGEMRGEERRKKRNDPVSGITGGLIVILLGVVLLLTTLDYVSWGDWWAYFLLGLGIILILDGLIRVSSRAYHQQTTGKFIGGAVLIIIGGANIFGMFSWWPAILIVVGAIIVISSLRKTAG